MQCPTCQSEKVVKNGSIHHGKKKFLCRACGRQFVEQPKHPPIGDPAKHLIDKLLLEKIPLAGIARVVNVSEKWLQTYVNHTYATIPHQVEVTCKKKRRLTIQCDELWSFVGRKQNKFWIWLALDQDTREIVGVSIGSRDEVGAKGLWQSLPPVYRQCAVCYTDFWSAYACIFPSKRHRAVGKETGHTSDIERVNNTLRQRISRLVRKTWSFSKKIANHVGAIWYFIHHYNTTLRLTLEDA